MGPHHNLGSGQWYAAECILLLAAMADRFPGIPPLLRESQKNAASWQPGYAELTALARGGSAPNPVLYHMLQVQQYVALRLAEAVSEPLAYTGPPPQARLPLTSVSLVRGWSPRPSGKGRRSIR